MQFKGGSRGLLQFCCLVQRLTISEHSKEICCNTSSESTEVQNARCRCSQVMIVDEQIANLCTLGNRRRIHCTQALILTGANGCLFGSAKQAVTPGKRSFQQNRQVKNLPSSAKTYLASSFGRTNVVRQRQSGNRHTHTDKPTDYSNPHAHARRALKTVYFQVECTGAQQCPR